MVKFRDEATGLPLPSWNLWEDRKGVHTFTCASIVGGLRAAAKFARLFNENSRAEKYERVADVMVAGMRKHLYSKSLGRFLRALQYHDGDYLDSDQTVDASLFGTFYFGAFAADDEMVIGTMNAIEELLTAKTDTGGIGRFQNDGYMRISAADGIPGNPWFICTLWLADHKIAIAKTEKELQKAYEILQWTVERALPSGVLAEQVNPLDGSPVSVAPLTWSHSTFVATTMSYLRKLAEFSPCEACQRPRFHPDRRAFTNQSL